MAAIFFLIYAINMSLDFLCLLYDRENLIETPRMSLQNLNIFKNFRVKIHIIYCFFKKNSTLLQFRLLTFGMLLGILDIETKLTTIYVPLIVGGSCVPHMDFPVAVMSKNIKQKRII